MTTVKSTPRLPAGKIIILTGAMFTFISYWRVAAVVLCDLASTAFYIGGIVEQAIGPAAPWFILAVMLFSYAVRSVYMESCSMFVRGGVYRVVKEALGGFWAKLSVSALIFDYVLTGPISGVSAGQYVVGLVLDSAILLKPNSFLAQPAAKDAIKQYGAMVIACAITLYFLWQNIIGIMESSGKALKIMGLTTAMAVIMLVWCGITLALRGPANTLPLMPELSKKVEFAVVQGTDRATGAPEEVWARNAQDGTLKPNLDGQGNAIPRINVLTGKQDDPLGFAGNTKLASQLRDPSKVNWWSVVGLLGILFAFGHSILAMSGEETLAQVYREVAAPKLPNFKKSAFIIFLYSLIFTAGMSFLAVLIIPDEVRMKLYSDNLIAGLATHMVGPPWALLALHAFVVLVGFLILSGAVNTALVGSNGVVNRITEDGILPASLLKPHRHYGTSYRVLLLIAGIQLAVILISRGNVLMLGEAYAFGVVWSFIFKALGMIILRFRRRGPRQYKVPLNIKLGNTEIPVGLIAIFLILFAAGCANLFSKEIATIAGLAFTVVLFVTLLAFERREKQKPHGEKSEFNLEETDTLSGERMQLKKEHRHLVWLNSASHLAPLVQALKDFDPKTTELIVLALKRNYHHETKQLNAHDLDLMKAALECAEEEGKPIRPLVVQTNDPLRTVTTAILQLGVDEVSLLAGRRGLAKKEMKWIGAAWQGQAGDKAKRLKLHAFVRSHRLDSEFQSA